MGYIIFAILGLSIIATPFLLIHGVESRYKKLNELLLKIEKEQLEEGEEIISKVVEINISKGTLEMDSGDSINFEGLKVMPEIGDTLKYIRTFGYRIPSLREGMEKVEEPDYLNIRIINKGVDLME